MKFGQSVEEYGIKVTPLPANHASNVASELTLIYLLEKDSTRLLYATDTAGLTAIALGLAGVGQFSREREFLTGIIMEANMAPGYQPDQRMFAHSSVDLVDSTVKTLTQTRKYVPVEGQKVYLTHLSKSEYGPQAEVDRIIPEPLKAAYDGLEVVFR